MSSCANRARRIVIAAIALVVALAQADALELAQDNTAPQPAPRRTNRAPAPAPQAAQPHPPAATQSQNQPQSPAPQQPAAAPAPPPAPLPQRTEILRFDNWTVICNEFVEPTPHRECVANMQVVAQASNQIVLQWTLGFDGNHQPGIVLQTPTGVAIVPGDEAPPQRAGMAASIEEVAFELGGAIGITILGALLAGVYSALFVIPKGAAVPASVLDGIDQALKVAETLPAEVAKLLTQAVHGAFDTAYLVTLAVDAVALILVACMAWRASTTAPARS